ncbi:phosphocholine cytidylyltransferase family protein [Kutzneria sp. NPDC051319]|uniref:phosphocholine cytidylyltransferase family protein n=1 Tax=Kutzneria sp. NPDC051319 TaxID=3155047 RepID=UPI003412F133
MKGVILAAGRGSRLGELTDDRPKCMVRLAGRPLLEWQRAALTAAGVSPLAVVAGYRSEQFGDIGLRVFPARRWAATNMVRSLLAASDWLAADTCVVSYGDIVYSADVVRRLAAATGDLAITYDPNWQALWSRRFEDPLTDAETFRLRPDGSLAAIGARPRAVQQIEGQYMGLLRFTPAGWARVVGLLARHTDRQIDAMDMTALLQALVDDGCRVDAVACPEPWGEVDSATDLGVCADLVAEGRLVFACGREVRR